MFLEKFFAPSGKFTAYEMFSARHFGIIIICFSFITLALYLSRNMNRKNIFKTVRICTAVLWTFEISKIIFNLYIGNAGNPNTYIPLYFCSITLYAGILSSFAKGRLKRVGDVFIMIGGIIGGVAYILSPCTTAGTYPAFHFITIQSFIHHSVMVYLGMLFIVNDYIVLKKKDWVYYTSTVILASITAYVVNMFLGTNLMFVSRTNPGTIVEVVYNISPRLFPVMITFWQAIPPFFAIYYLVKAYKYAKNPCRNSKEVHI